MEMDKIYCGDSSSVLKSFDNEIFDMVLTSPPYNFDMNYDVHNDRIFWKEYFDKLFGILSESCRVLKNGGRIAIVIQPMFSDYIPTHHRISQYLEGLGMLWKAEILWEKNNYNAKYTSWGSWRSPSSPYFKYTWEFVEVFCKGQRKKNGVGQFISADDFKKWTTAKWNIAPQRDGEHPAKMPDELASRLIQLFSFPEDVILDPFFGVGTTGLISSRNNRKWVGIDISENYCKLAQKRIDADKISTFINEEA